MQHTALLPKSQSGLLISASIALLVIVGIAFISGHAFGFHFDGINLSAIHDFIVRLGPWGPIAYIAILIVSVVISQIPGAPLVILAGTIWPPFWAAIFTVMGGFTGAVLAYGLGRTLGAPFIQKMTGQTFQFESEQNKRRLGGLIFLSRLVPVVPFDLLSYGAGASRISWPLYATATLFGMIPSTFLLAYGTTIDFAELATGLYSYL